MIYTVGRFWIEYLRIDDVQLEHVLGLRFNDWTSIVCFAGGAAYFLWSLKKHPGPGPEVYVDPAAHAAALAAASGEAEPESVEQVADPAAGESST
jgi:hypothetical protein